MSLAPGDPTRNEPALAGLVHDQEAFLLHAREWQPDLIEVLANKDGVPKTPERREFIEYIRNGFGKNPGIPAARGPLRHRHPLRSRDTATRRLYPLIPHVCGQQACMIAGMHKPIPDV